MTEEVINKKNEEPIVVPEEIQAQDKTYSYTHVLEAAKDYFHGEELPAKVFVDKYAMKDLDGKIYENTPDQMHWRLAKEFGRIERDFMQTKLNGNDPSKLSDYGKTRQILSVQRIYEMFKDFKYIIPQGSVMAILGNQFVIGSLSNCIVLPELHDSYGGILYSDQQLVQLMKRRCGVGLDLSTLRPSGSSVTNAAGSSTGPVSFMERFSNTTREVAQSGRRGALMLTIDIAHPDVESFINIKQDLSKITGANISVRLSDEFMQAVKDNGDYTHRWPIDEHLKPGQTQIKKTVKATELWNTIIKAAHTSAEPGLIFWDRQHKYSTSSIYPGFKNTSTNPCLTKDTWIMTNQGPKEISELIGTPFVSIANGKESVSSDEGFFCTGVKKVYKLKTRNGFEIKATDNHPFRIATDVNRKNINSEMTELKNIKLGDLICLANDRPIFWDGKGNNEIGWLLGSLLGDGTITEDRAYLCYWGDSKMDMKKTAISYVKNNLSYREGFLGEGAEVSYDIDVHDRTRFGSAELKKLAEEYGYVKDKKLKKEIEKTSSHFYRGFLSGWFDADGTVQVDMEKGVSVRLSSSILENLKIAQRMLARLGIISKVYENRKPEGWYDMPDGKGGLKSVLCNAGHELTITKDNIKEFYYEVGFLEEAKQNKIKVAIDQHSRGFYRERFVDIVTEITEIGEEEVFDCTVFPDHEFEANGFLVHNCSEIAMQGGDSCRLIAMNLFGCVVNPFAADAYFDYDKFYEITYESQRLMDDLVELELEAVSKIIAKIQADPEPEKIKQVELDTWNILKEAGRSGRRTGLGFTALGDAIAALGFKFDSAEALALVDKIMKTKLRGEFDSSIDMAVERGAFEAFDKNIEQTSEFVQMMKVEFNDVYGRMLQHGRRNISISTVAPTGCLEESAKIRTDRGIMTFRDIFEINNLDTDDLKNSKSVWFDFKNDVKVVDINGKYQKINKLYWHGSTEGYNFTFSDKTSLKMSKTQKFLVLIDDKTAVWKESKDLEVGNKIIKLKK